MAYKKLIKVSNVCQVLDKSKYNPSQTRSGITWTNNGDGSWTANGIAEKNFAYANINQNIPFSNLNGHIIYICIDSTNLVSGVTLELKIQDNKGNGLYYRYDIQNEIINLRNISSSVIISISALAINKDIILENYTFKPQLFYLTEMYGAGHEPTTVEEFRQKFPEEMYDYSPYCWLTSYKRVFLTGDGNYLTSYKRNLTCKTKNLFDINSVSNINNWVTSVSSAHPYGYYTFYLKPNTTYTFSRKYASNNDSVFACFSKNYGVADGDGFFIHPTSSSIVKDKLSFTTDDTGIMYLNVYGIRSVMNSFIELIEEAQLELGSTATDYLPYGHL